MLNPEKRVLEELEIFLEEGVHSGSGNFVYEEVLEKLAQLEIDLSREYNLAIT
jgi:hypothetical protein